MTEENESKIKLYNFNEWFRNHTKVAVVGKLKKLIEITTPYLDNHNDYIQIYLRRRDDGVWEISDDSIVYACNDMETDANIFNDVLFDIFHNRGLKINKDAQTSYDGVITLATDEDLYNKIHAVLQAVVQTYGIYRFRETEKNKHETN